MAPTTKLEVELSVGSHTIPELNFELIKALITRVLIGAKAVGIFSFMCGAAQLGKSHRRGVTLVPTTDNRLTLDVQTDSNDSCWRWTATIPANNGDTVELRKLIAASADAHKRIAGNEKRFFRLARAIYQKMNADGNAPETFEMNALLKLAAGQIGSRPAKTREMINTLVYAGMVFTQNGNQYSWQQDFVEEMEKRRQESMLPENEVDLAPENDNTVDDDVRVETNPETPPVCAKAKTTPEEWDKMLVAFGEITNWMTFLSGDLGTNPHAVQIFAGHDITTIQNCVKYRADSQRLLGNGRVLTVVPETVTENGVTRPKKKCLRYQWGFANNLTATTDPKQETPVTLEISDGEIDKEITDLERVIAANDELTKATREKIKMMGAELATYRKQTRDARKKLDELLSQKQQRQQVVNEAAEVFSLLTPDAIQLLTQNPELLQKLLQRKD